MQGTGHHSCSGGLKQPLVAADGLSARFLGPDATWLLSGVASPAGSPVPCPHGLYTEVT